MLPIHEPILIAFCGLSGSGKTTRAQQMARQLDAVLFEQDWTLIEQAHRPGPHFKQKFDLAEADALIRALLDGRPAVCLGFDQVTRRRDMWIVLPPRPIIVVEGVLALHIPVVRERANVKFWVEAPLEVCEARQLARFERQGWYQGLARDEMLARIQGKRVEEAPAILEQKAWCDWVIDNSAPSQPALVETPEYAALPQRAA